MKDTPRLALVKEEGLAEAEVEVPLGGEPGRKHSSGEDAGAVRR